MQSLPDLYPIFIQRNVHFLGLDGFLSTLFYVAMWQCRLVGKLIRVSLRTQDKNVA